MPLPTVLALAEAFQDSNFHHLFITHGSNDGWNRGLFKKVKMLGAAVHQRLTHTALTLDSADGKEAMIG
ncbi:hypothetical protein [Limosilactobacillus vaginalis]